MDERVEAVAAWLVAEGRVVPGLTVEPDGRARSWWWPMPAARHRSAIASLVTGPSSEDQVQAATELSDATDALVRRRLLLWHEEANEPTTA